MDVYFIRGLPGAGKSTLARQYAAAGYLHLEADMFFVGADGVYRFNAEQLGAAHAWCQARMAEALAAGCDVVVANTFSRRWELESYQEIALRYGARIHEITASGTYQNVHGVPEAAIAAMRARWED